MLNFSNDWSTLLNDELDKSYFKLLVDFLDTQYLNETIYPPRNELFSAFELTPYSSLKVVILGQDPYHQFGQANGLAFSVKDGIKIPPSLKNIYKEIEASTGAPMPSNGNLTRWAKQGVLLLNTVLTVRDSHAGSHRGKGWEVFTDSVIALLNQHSEPIIFMLWGSDAQKKAQLISNTQHTILTAPHPSPLSAYRGFFGCNHFVQANEFLQKMGKVQIEW